MTRQMVCEGQCNNGQAAYTVQFVSAQLQRAYLATYTLVDGKPSVLLEPSLVRASRAWVHTGHEPCGLGDWRCLSCGCERR